MDLNPRPNVIELIILLAARHAEKDGTQDVYVDNRLAAENVGAGMGAAAPEFSLSTISPEVHIVPRAANSKTPCCLSILNTDVWSNPP